MLLLLVEDLSRALGSFPDQEAHSGPGGFQVSLQSDGPQTVGCGRPDRSDHNALDTIAQRVFDFHLRSNLKQMRDLYRGGKENDVYLTAGEALCGLPERSRILR